MLHAITTAVAFTCCDDLALIWVVSSGFEDGVCEEAGAALEGGQVPDDTRPIC